MRDKPAIRRRVEELADRVYLPRRLLNRYPHQLSGGEKARVGIARALASNPQLLILDEATTALDVSVQGQIMLLLDELRREFKVSYLFVSHDLGLVRLLCDRVLIMQKGRIVEQGRVAEVFQNPRHLHTRDLLKSLPTAVG